MSSISKINRQLLFENFIEFEREKQRKDNRPMFQGIPEEWLEANKWCCHNGHVHDLYIKSEVHCARCLTCGGHVRLFPTGVSIEEFHQILKI